MEIFSEMKNGIFTILMMAAMLCNGQVWAQEKDENTPVDTSGTKILVSTPRRFYTGNGYDFIMLSSANFSRPGREAKLTTPRFTAMVNIGFNFHYDLNKSFGVFTGIGLKNLGFIEKNAYTFNGEDVTIKRRVYTIGVPLGFKFGNLRDRTFVFAGGGIDLPFNYREKRFTKRSNKLYKDSEWFSDQAATLMPYVFIGASVNPGFIVKAQYYPGNFFNEDYETKNNSGITYRPYAGYKANIFSLCFSIDVHYNQYKIQEKEYQKMKQEREIMGKK